MPHMQEEDFGEPPRPDWLLGFEGRDGGTVVCIHCAAVVVKSATYTSRHREWHIRRGN